MALRNDNILLQKYIEKAMVDLPALPSVIVQVLQTTEKETATTSEVERLLTTDAALVTKLLKVVNSAYFGLPRQVGNVGQAVSILGMHQVRNLVLSVGVLNALNSPSPKVVEAQRRFWEASFSAATCAQTLARIKGLSSKDADLCFIGAMLHDVGRLFLFSTFNQPYQQVVAESNRLQEPVTVSERRILGTDHAELGGLLAERWNFPEELVTLVRYHEDPSQATDAGSLPKLYCVHLADRIATEVLNDREAGFLPLWNAAAWSWLSFSDAQVDELKSEVGNYVEHAKALLGIL